MSKQESRPIPMLTLDEISSMRSQYTDSAANTQTGALILINQLTNQHEILLSEVKFAREQNITLNTQLKVAEVEINKLKEKIKKPDTPAVETTPKTS